MKVSILGHFGEGERLLNGQTVKTKIITDELERVFGKESVLKIDTHGGAKVLLKAPLQVLKALKSSENVVIFPAQNGLRVYAPLLFFVKKLFNGKRLHYCVIGGWLPEFLNNKKHLEKILKQFDGIYVETNTMKKTLENKDFSNIFVMPNCKRLTVLSEGELVYPISAPYKLCTFSRVMKEKGIEDAVNAVSKINNELGYKAYTLDIYGQVDSSQTAWFESLKANFPEFVKYRGCVDSDKSVEVLKNYFALLFPTRFYTEGIPGTVIDAYAAGIPVISARWESFFDVIEDKMTGFGYEFENENELKTILKSAVESPKEMLDLKVNCLKKAEEYLPKTALRVMCDKL